MYKRLKKSNHTQNTLTTSLVTIIGFTPSLWLIWNLFEKLPFKQLKTVTFFSIPCLFLVGFIWGIKSQEKYILDLANDVDRLEKHKNNT